MAVEWRGDGGSGASGKKLAALHSAEELTSPGACWAAELEASKGKEREWHNGEAWGGGGGFISSSPSAIERDRFTLALLLVTFDMLLCGGTVGLALLLTALCEDAAGAIQGGSELLPRAGSFAGIFLCGGGVGGKSDLVILLL